MALSYKIVEWTNLEGHTLRCRVYDGQKVALIIPEVFFDPNYRPEPKTISAYGPWPGVTDAALTHLLGWLDKGFNFYQDFTGLTPAVNSQYPSRSPVVFTPFTDMNAAGLGLVGVQGFQLAPAYFDFTIFAAQRGEIIQTIYWHEFGRNFSVGSGSSDWDPGVKYILTDVLSVPTFMNEYTNTYTEFLIDQNYLLMRYFMADTAATWSVSVSNPFPKPNIPDVLESRSLHTSYNGGDLRTALAYQFYLENGLDAWKNFAKWLFNTDLKRDTINDQLQVIERLNQVSGRFDYTYVFKSGWKIVDRVLEPRGVSESLSAGPRFYYLGSRHDDVLRLTTGGQNRVDGGDGFDTVYLDILSTEVAKEVRSSWSYSFSTVDSRRHVSTNFVERVVFADGVVRDISYGANSLPLMLNSFHPVLDARGNLWVRLVFSEAIMKAPNSQGLLQYGLRDAETGRVYENYDFTDPSPENWSIDANILTLRVKSNKDSFGDAFLTALYGSLSDSALSTPFEFDAALRIFLRNGSSFSELLVAGPGRYQIILAGAGQDTVIGGGQADYLDGGEGDDWIESGFAVSSGLPIDDTLLGGSGEDTVIGGLGFDTISGGDGNDRLAGGPGNDYLDGGTGRDEALYISKRADYQITRMEGRAFLITGADGNDTLVNVERVKFSDSFSALDLDVADLAGQAVLLIGAILGKDLMLAKRPLMGAVIDLFDQGYTIQQLAGALMRLPIWAGTLTATNSSIDIANYLLNRVNGRAPTAAELAAAVKSLETDVQGAFLANLALTPANISQVDLVGLSKTGFDYPLGG